MYRNLNHYIERLRKSGEIVEIEAKVDPELEITEITDRISKQQGGGKALLFENTGTQFPVLTNMMGSDARIAMALGVESLDELNARIESLFVELTAPKMTLYDKLKMLPILGKMSRWMPRHKRGRGECQAVVMTEPDLSKLPILKCWKYDGGRFITLPLVHTKDPQTGARNVGMYRMQVFSENTTGMHWHRHKTGARHYAEYRARGERMPVTVCLGGDPAYTYSATAPLPDNVDEYLLAGFIRQRPVELVKCLTNDLEVPSDCDFVIEGYIDTSEDGVVEGPFGDHTGFYSLEDIYPLFHVTCITHRRDAVYPATIVGVPPQEDAYIAKATERIFLAPIRMVMQSEVVGLTMPLEGTAHNIAIVNIGKSYPAQGFKVASSMWGAGQMMFNKFMVVASTDIDITDSTKLNTLIKNVSIPRDILFSRGTLDVLDHASDVMGMGGKMCIDATTKLPEEGGEDADIAVFIPTNWEMTPDVVKINHEFAQERKTLFITVSKDCTDCAGAATRFLELNKVGGIKFIIAFDPHVPLDDISTLVWYAAANCDGARDVAVQGSTLIFDARVKLRGTNGFDRPTPNVVTTDPETIKRIDERWNSLGLGEFIASPSLRFLPLVLHDGAEFLGSEK